MPAKPKPSTLKPSSPRTAFQVAVATALLLALVGIASTTLRSAEVETEVETPADPPAAGHSYHGEAFNEGPRQSAYRMGTTGQVHFPVTTQIEEAQFFFDQGIGQLHGFWYFEAERSFRQVAALDPDCVMAYWGMAMANIENRTRARGLVAKAVERKDEVSEREQRWISGLADFFDDEANDKSTRQKKYIESLEELVHEYPDDLEAKAFLIVRLWQFKSELPIVSPIVVNALLGDILEANPAHPTHHYRIHLWDKIRPEEALASAALCGQSAPGIAHMWHMPGHIFSRLERFADAAWQQEASARVDHAHMMRDGVLPDQIHNYAHNNEWLIRNLNHIGRVEDALDLAKNMLELPRHPAYNTLSKSRGSSSYGRRRLMETLERFELWDETLSLAETMYLEPTDLPEEQEKRLVALGRAYFGKGDLERLEQTIDTLRQRHEEADAESRDGLEMLRNYRKELLACRLFLRGEAETAVELLDALDGLGAEREAHWALLGKAYIRAEELLRELVEENPHQVALLANYAFVLERNGKADEAQEVFERLRKLSAHIDPDAPPFARLRPLARRLGHPAGWRVEATIAEDVGKRPVLDELGAFQWSPSPAPTWSLTDASEAKLSLESFRGKPVVLIFYLGFGCLHCVEQLETFSPKMEAFQDAGISIVAIGTENREQLLESLKAFREDGKTPPFPLLASGDLEVFKAYRAYDDFEDQPLHGTFLIDESGLVRWQDISYEPFNDVDFLLGEARRLLRVPRPGRTRLLRL